MDFDVIVIGSGAGGGFAAVNLAKAGKKVMLLERGPDPFSPRPEKSETPFKHVIDQRSYRHNNSPKKLFMGDGIGGSTSIYGAVLVRPKKEDFSPGSHMGEYLHSEDYSWPVDYEEFLPYFEKVEAHFNMAPFEEGQFGQPEELAPINASIAQKWHSKGYHPGILPLAIDRKTCILCPDCPGYVCPTQARGSTRQSIIHELETNPNMHLTTNAEVVSINPEEKGVTYKILGGEGDKLLRLTADKIILSAGAINSAAILLRSGFGDRFPMLGKCFMYHAGAVSFSLFKDPTNGGKRFIKQLGLNDFYFGTEEFPHKMGVFQSLPTPRAATRPVRNHLYLMMATVEDLPTQSNRVELDASGNVKVFHKFHPYDIFRSKHAKKLLTRLMADGGAIRSLAATAQMNKSHVGHQVGTVRFGKSPKTSVLNKWCQPHGVDNLFVLDGGFLPTSMGASPALTIMANALRVTDHIIDHF